MISEVYGGGMSIGAPYGRDYIVLHNRGTTTVDIGGWSVQYASATGPAGLAGKWDVHAIPSGTQMKPGAYLLIGESGTDDPPLPVDSDVKPGGLGIAAGAGKVALVRNTTALTGTCPLMGVLPGISPVIDLVGFGTTATCSEGGTSVDPGGASAPAPDKTTSVQRKADGKPHLPGDGSGAGCIDNDNNAKDFEVGVPSPRSSASERSICAICE